MIKKIYTYRSSSYDAAYNQAIEGFLTFWVPADAVVLYLWQNDRTVVIGRNQNAYEEVRVPLLEADGGFLARRISGGGAVYHDRENLNFTFCVRDPNYDLQRQLQVILQAVAKFGLKANFSGRNDILLDGRKFSGNAFYRSGAFRYHHGTLLINVNGEAMAKYLSPPKAKLASKGVKSVRSRVVNLKSLVPDLTPDLLAQAMQEAFCEVYGLPAEEIKLEDLIDEESRNEALSLDQKSNNPQTTSPTDCPAEPGLPLQQAAVPNNLEMTKENPLNPGLLAMNFSPASSFASWLAFFRNPAWRLGRKAEAQIQGSQRFPWGTVQVFLQTEGDLIREATLFSDAMYADLIARLNQILPGLHLRRDELSEALAALRDKFAQNSAGAKSPNEKPDAAIIDDIVQLLADLI